MIPAPHAQLTILAIDAEASAQQALAGVLETAGYCCHCARDAESAAEAVRRATPDLIIADLNLAGHSGLSLCEHLKEQSGISEVPVMYLSALQGPDIIRRSHATGGTYYLRKPFDGSVLVQLVEKVTLAAHLAGA